MNRQCFKSAPPRKHLVTGTCTIEQVLCQTRARTVNVKVLNSSTYGPSQPGPRYCVQTSSVLAPDNTKDCRLVTYAARSSPNRSHAWTHSDWCKPERRPASKLRRPFASIPEQ